MVEPGGRVLRRCEEGVAHELQLLGQRGRQVGPVRLRDGWEQLRALVPSRVVGEVGLDLGGGEGCEGEGAGEGEDEGEGEGEGAGEGAKRARSLALVSLSLSPSSASSGTQASLVRKRR